MQLKAGRVENHFSFGKSDVNGNKYLHSVWELHLLFLIKLIRIWTECWTNKLRELYRLLSFAEAETTSELSRLEDAYKMKENRQGHLHRSKVTVKGPSLSQPCAHSTAYSSMCSQTSRGRTLSQIPGDTLGISSITNSQVTFLFSV